MLNLINGKQKIILGYSTSNSKIHVSGFDAQKGQIIIQLDQSDLRRYKLYSNNKGYYFNLKGKRVYILTEEVKTNLSPKTKKDRKPFKYTILKGSDFMINPKNPTRKDLIFMYEWLIYKNTLKKQYEDIDYYKFMIKQIKNSEDIKINNYSVVPLIAYYSSRIPEIYNNHKVANNTKNYKESGLSIKESIQSAEEFVASYL